MEYTQKIEKNLSGGDNLMDDSINTPSRKTDHIRINLEKDVSSDLTTGLEKIKFIHQALPELDLEKVDLTQTLFGKPLAAPILISSMTGGTKEAGRINQILAQAAQAEGIALGLGSQRAGLENPEVLSSFQVRKMAPDILLLANLGAVQLNYTCTIDDCRRAVEEVGADGLFLHLNALQEAVQPEGETRFHGLLKKIEEVCRRLSVPVIAKEVGWGISKKTASMLASAGVSAIDAAGAGGTSWSQVEMHRIQDEIQAQIAGAFRDWGIPTVESIRNIKNAVPGMTVFASGGLRNGVDIAKCIAIGADLGGMATPFLKTAAVSTEETIRLIRAYKREIQICLFATGSAKLTDLRKAAIIENMR
ncbi:MAG: type 2 isopentenyl-diphosphate Delta-isomerase [Anaerolineaceae bacterium]